MDETARSSGRTRSRKWWLLAAAALALGLLALDVERARTQSITHDEALTFLRFAAGPLDRVFAEFQPNNHVLHSALVWYSARHCGYSELALRLPSLLGGALCLAAALGVCRALFGSGPLLLLGYALLALNPLLLDFLSAARGYSLGLGFLLLAMLQVLHLVRADAGARAGTRRGDLGRAAVASVAAVLSVASHVSLAPACAGLLLLGLLGLVTDPHRDRRLRTAALLVLPALLGLALLARTLPPAGSVPTFFGPPAWQGSALDLVQRSLAHHDVRWPLDTQGAAFVAQRDALAFVGVPLLVVTLVLVGAARARRFHALRPEHRALLLVGGTLVLTVVQWAGLHLALDVPWPVDRTGLTFLVLAGVCAVALARAAREHRGALRAGGAAVLALLGFLAVQQAFQLQASHYAVWRFDAGARDIMEQVREREALRDEPAADGSVHLVLGSWLLEPALSFYRLQTRARWLAPIERDAFDPAAPWDYLVTTPPLPPGAADARVIFTDPVSGTMLAVPGGAR